MQKLFNNEIRAWMKYYATQISDSLEWIKGLEKHNIDNDEVEYYYGLIMDYSYSLHGKLEEYTNKEVMDDLILFGV